MKSFLLVLAFGPVGRLRKRLADKPFVVATDLPVLRREYGLRSYNGTRTGCKRLANGTGRCTRLRHTRDHSVEPGKVLTAYSVAVRVEQEAYLAAHSSPYYS